MTQGLRVFVALAEDLVQFLEHTCWITTSFQGIYCPHQTHNTHVGHIHTYIQANIYTCKNKSLKYMFFQRHIQENGKDQLSTKKNI